MIIYVAENILNGKKYVGKTIKSLNERRLEHISESIRKNFHFYKAIRKYGIDNFKWYIVDTAISDAELNDLEIEWIARLQSLSTQNGYNMNDGGAGGKMIPEVEERRRQSLMGHKVSDATRRKISERNAGGTGGGARKGVVPWNKGTRGLQKCSSETRRKMSASRKGVPKSNSHKKKLAEHLNKVRPNLNGKLWSEERKNQHSIRMKRWWNETKNSL